MRIRSTKPEFWRSERIASVDWEVVHDGPMPKRVNTIAPMSSEFEYVYMLFDEANSLVYVGRSFRPADRFTKHRRKSWWPQVKAVVLIRVREEPRHRRPPWQKAGPNTARLEAYAISMLHPSANIAGPSKGAMSEVAS